MGSLLKFPHLRTQFHQNGALSNDFQFSYSKTFSFSDACGETKCVALSFGVSLQNL